MSSSSLFEYVLSWVPWSNANARYRARVAFFKQETADIRTILRQLSTQHAADSTQFCSEVESILSDDDNNFDERKAALIAINHKKRSSLRVARHWILLLPCDDNECRRRLSNAFELQTDVSTLAGALAEIQQLDTTLHSAREMVLQSIAESILHFASVPLKQALLNFTSQLKLAIRSDADFDQTQTPLVDAITQCIVNVGSSSDGSVQARDQFFRYFLNEMRDPFATGGTKAALATCRLISSAFEQINDRVAMLALHELCAALTTAKQRRRVRVERERLERERRLEAERKEAEKRRLIDAALDEFVQLVEFTIRYGYGPAVWCAVEKIVSKCGQRPKTPPDIPRSWKLVDIVKARAKNTLTVSECGKFICVNHLTPCRDADERRFGSFRCVKCGRSWCSANSWADSWQQCVKCKIKVYPYQQDELQRRDSDDDDDDDSEDEKPPHPMELCQRCQQLGYSCVRRRYQSDYESDTD